jgi:hypothetical protein
MPIIASISHIGVVHHKQRDRVMHQVSSHGYHLEDLKYGNTSTGQQIRPDDVE